MGNLDGEINQAGGSFKDLLEIIVFIFILIPSFFLCPLEQSINWWKIIS
jgi:hypothetical protein